MKQLVENGQIKFGIFKEAIENVNLIDARISRYVRLPKWAKNLRLKEFQAFMFGDETYFCVVAIFNAKLSAFAQIRIFNKIHKQELIYESTVAPWKLNIPNTIIDSRNTFKNNQFEININNQLKNNIIEINFKVFNKNSTPIISAFVQGNFNHAESLVASIPFGNNVGMYAHKCIVPTSGNLTINGNKHEFNENDSFFICDDHKGFYPYVLEWDWVTTAFKYNNQLIGLNLTKNQSIDNERFNENAIWINGIMTKLPAVEFTRTADSWHIRDKQGSIDLIFVPKFPKNVRINYGPFGASNYEGPMGYLRGKITYNSGEEIRFEDVFSFAEKQYIRC